MADLLTVIANPVVIIPRNKRDRVELRLYDEDGNAVDATELTLSVLNAGGTSVYEDDFINPPAAGTRIVHAETGRYYILWGDPSAPANIPTQTETSYTCNTKQIFVWCITGPAGTSPENTVQVVKIASPMVLAILPDFRAQIDKAAKRNGTDPKAFCPLGYGTQDLLGYLEGGLQVINAYQPYPCWRCLEDFPTSLYGQILFDAALYVGVNAQSLFAVDTDIENWSNQGNTFVLNHFPKLQQFNQAIIARLDRLVPDMKRHFVQSGSVLTEMGPSFRLNMLLSAAPTGTVIRNLVSR